MSNCFKKEPSYEKINIESNTHFSDFFWNEPFIVDVKELPEVSKAKEKLFYRTPDNNLYLKSVDRTKFIKYAPIEDKKEEVM